jgi:hypothetical protein
MKKTRRVISHYVLRDGNTKQGDNSICDYCHKIIPVVNIWYGNRKYIDRRMRIDCQIKKVFVSYHLPCYDLKVFGYVRHSTLLKIKEFAYYDTFIIPYDNRRNIEGNRKEQTNPTCHV